MRTFIDFMKAKASLDEGLFGWGSKPTPKEPFTSHPVVKQNPKLLKLIAAVRQKSPDAADAIIQRALAHGAQAAEFHLSQYIYQNKQIPLAKNAGMPHDASYTGDLRTYDAGSGRGGIMGRSTVW